MHFETTSYSEALDRLFAKKSNASQANWMKKYMRNQFEFYGIQTPLRRQLLKTHIQQYGLPPIEKIQLLSHKLWQAKYRELHYCTIEILHKLNKQWTIQSIDVFKALAVEKAWWDSVDSINGFLVGPYFQKFPQKIQPITKRWNNSDNIWLQRLSIIFQLQYKQQTDQQLLFKYIDNLKQSDEFFVQKAIGWSLRQYARVQPTTVRDFVQRADLKPLSAREALKHL